jgi:hypothetical protein
MLASNSFKEQYKLLKTQINQHSLYSSINSIDTLRLFMEQHVFAVWDFMCLLKELHRHIVSVSAPWFPPRDALTAQLISSILVEEEGDLAEDGKTYQCHYDIYLDAMRKIGASTTNIDNLLLKLRNHTNIVDAINSLPILPETKEFVLTTFSFFSMHDHQIAAAFVYGREVITPIMFEPLLEFLECGYYENNNKEFGTLIFYLKRHIQLDSEEHFPKAMKMLENLTEGDERKLAQVEEVALIAMKARLNLLNGIYNQILNARKTLSKVI